MQKAVAMKVSGRIAAVGLAFAMAGALVACSSGSMRPGGGSASVTQERKTGEEQSGEPPLSKEIKTQSDFEHSEFCRRYRCKERDHWSVQNGDMNHTYETSVHDLSVEIQINTNRDPNVTGFGLMFLERTRLSSEEFDVINTLTRSADQTAKHDKTISFIRENVESPVCRTCQVDQAAKSIIDGDFRIWAGKSRPEQVIVFKRLSR